MSVMMVMRVEGDSERFRSFIQTQGDVLRAIADDAQNKGCLHHRFAIGDGYVLVIDEWESPEAFRGFFEGNEEIPRAMAESGARGEPQITFAEAVESPDMF